MVRSSPPATRTDFGPVCRVTSLHRVVAAMRDPDPQVCANTAYVCTKLQRLPPEVVPLLLGHTTSPDDGLRLNALRALRSVPVADGEPVLTNLLEDPNLQIALQAAIALLHHDPKTEGIEEVLAKALTTPAKLVFIETPANPTLRLTDIDLTARLAKKAGALLVVDNTLLTPALQRPFRQASPARSSRCRRPQRQRIHPKRQSYRLPQQPSRPPARSPARCHRSLPMRHRRAREGWRRSASNRDWCC